MQILSVHNWNCVRCFGNMLKLKQVILGTRVWSFSFWYQLCSSHRLCLTMASLWRASQIHSRRVPLYVLAPCSRRWGCTPCLSGAGVPSNETWACRWHRELQGDLLGKPGRRSAGGLPSTPSHSWHALLVTEESPSRVQPEVHLALMSVSDISWKCMLGKSIKKGQACSIAPPEYPPMCLQPPGLGLWILYFQLMYQYSFLLVSMRAWEPGLR